VVGALVEGIPWKGGNEEDGGLESNGAPKKFLKPTHPSA
jgi:hypothetical protein